MTAKGFYTAQEGHVVNVIPPIDITGGKNGDRFSMKNYAHATIILQIGVSAAAFTSIIVANCDAASGGTATAIAFDYYAETTDAGDTLGGKTSVAATGITSVTANNNTMYVIEVDAQQLADGFEWVELQLANGSNSVIASAIAILSGSRFASDQSGSAIV